MKKYFAFLLPVLLLLATCGCQHSTDWEPTQELNIEMRAYEGGGSPMQVALNRAIALYQQAYPEVQVNITNVSFRDSYSKELGTRMMAGEGPDLIFVDEGLLFTNDLYKMQKAGAFEDLTQVLAADIDLEEGPYQRIIFDSIAYEGHNYLIPLHYSLPMFITTEEAMAKSHIDFEGAGDTIALLTELGDYWEQEQHKEKPAYAMTYPRYILMSPHIAGMHYGDYKTGEVQIDFDVLRQILDQWKRTHRLNVPDVKISLLPIEPELLYDQMQAGTFTSSFGFYGYSNYFRALQWFGQGSKPRLYPWRNMEGGVTAKLESALAIRRGAPNAQNAWNFIQIALSKEAQMDVTNVLWYPHMTCIPVNRQVWEEAFQQTFSNRLVYDDPPLELPAVPQEDYDRFVALQEEITGVFLRFPTDREVFDMFTPYLEGTASFEKCRQDAEDFLRIYLSE
ncbi:MAG: carbohydrate ABC transporter substrate-binding protein [Oscillospiraceae bacterium]|jgi:ABC-type glycerol-3-phosphate transport system substrate-binding protein|nr:carbohydrate ABC transporter substrate-binding protein [Oscillospiraceae bacterium]